MRMGYVLKTFAIFAAALLLVYGGFEATIFLKNHADDNLTPINVSYAQTAPSNTADNLVQIEITINDNSFSADEKITEVKFNKENIILKKADNQGKRGLTFLQVKPGSYTLSWKIKNSRYNFSKYSKNINITPADMWIHVLIKGAQITITN